MEQKLYVDEPCVVSFFVGEMGWFLQRWQAFLRYLKHEVYKEHKFLLMTHMQYHPFVHDFITYTVDLPKEFLNLKLETDCYEAPLPKSPPGSHTPPEIWAALIKYIRNYYNVEEAEEIWTPRGVNFWVDKRPQIFKKYVIGPEIKSDKPIIVVLPRYRMRASQRNVPPFVWKEIVDILKRNCLVVLGGTPNGTCLADYEGENVINLIRYNGDDKLEKIINYLNCAECSVSSQSGLTHVSLLSGCPSYIIGHENQRHSSTENRLGVPVSFRYVTDYRAIDARTIAEDLQNFLNILGKMKTSTGDQLFRPSMSTLKQKKNLVGAEIGVYAGLHALNILTNLDIHKLYLIDPYEIYPGLDTAAGTETANDMNSARNQAEEILADHKDKIVWIKDFSENAVKKIKEDLDFVYIDGNHKYDYVKKDLELYFPLIKEDGLMAGHDYDEGNSNNGVKRAVNEFFKDKDMKVFSAISRDSDNSNDWWCFKHGMFGKITEDASDKLEKLVRV